MQVAWFSGLGERWWGDREVSERDSGVSVEECLAHQLAALPESHGLKIVVNFYILMGKGLK